MAYTKTTWVNRLGTNLNKFTKTSETATSVILTNSPDAITQAGTEFTIARMNNIETGLDDIHNNSISIGGVKTFTDTTDSTSPTTGGAKFSGGVGIVKKLIVGDKIYGSNGLLLEGTATQQLKISNPVSGIPSLLIDYRSGLGQILLRADSGDSFFNAGNLAIGKTTADEKLDVAGNIKASGVITGTNILSTTALISSDHVHVVAASGLTTTYYSYPSGVDKSYVGLIYYKSGSTTGRWYTFELVQGSNEFSITSNSYTGVNGGGSITFTIKWFKM